MRSYSCLATAVLGLALLGEPAAVEATPGDLHLGFGGFGVGGKIDSLPFDVRDAVLDPQGRLTAGKKAGALRLEGGGSPVRRGAR